MKTALGTVLCLVLTFSAAAANSVPIPQASKGAPLTTQTTHATGPFDVKLNPQPADPKAGGETFSRLLLDKHFHGDLEATSIGTMIAAGTSTKGSAGYVAIEYVTGTLNGHPGTFVLQHTGTMTRGTPTLSITVVPDSGTGQLVGLTGKMNINIAPDGKHSYDFEYTLPEATQ
jgi:hypothetical protein